MARLEYTVPESHRLDLLIRDTNAEIEDILGERDKLSVKGTQLDLTAVVLAWTLGGMLNASKAMLGHGNWGAYQRSQAGWPNERSARDYMRIAAHFGSAANLPGSIRAALAALQGKGSNREERAALRDATREAVDRLWTIDRPRALALLTAWNTASAKAMRLQHVEVVERAEGKAIDDVIRGTARAPETSLRARWAL